MKELREGQPEVYPRPQAGPSIFSQHACITGRHGSEIKCAVKLSDLVKIVLVDQQR